MTINEEHKELVLKLYRNCWCHGEVRGPALTGVIMNGWAVVEGDGPVCMPEDQVKLTEKGLQLAKALSIEPVNKA